MFDDKFCGCQCFDVSCFSLSMNMKHMHLGVTGEKALTLGPPDYCCGLATCLVFSLICNTHFHGGGGGGGGCNTCPPHSHRT